MLILTPKCYYWLTIFFLTLVNSPKKVRNEQINRSVRYGNSRAQQVKLAHRVRKVQDTMGT